MRIALLAVLTIDRSNIQTDNATLAKVIGRNEVFGRSPADLDSEGALLLTVQQAALDQRWQACRAASTVGMFGDAELARAAWQKNGW